MFGRLICFVIEVVNTDFVELSTAHPLKKQNEDTTIFLSRDTCKI